MYGKKLNLKELLESELVPWTSRAQIKRLIDEENFPAFVVSNKYYFCAKEIELWWKKRTVRVS